MHKILLSNQHLTFFKKSRTSEYISEVFVLKSVISTETLDAFFQGICTLN